VTTIFTRKNALKIGHVEVVPSWLDKYKNCHLRLNPSPNESDEFSFTKVLDVVTNSRALTESENGQSYEYLCLTGSVRVPSESVSSNSIPFPGKNLECS
jgi:hypothetical protein